MTGPLTETLVDLPVVASLIENPGFVTIGVMYEGVFLPLGNHPAGHVADRKAKLSLTGAKTVAEPVAAVPPTPPTPEV
jgi:hypothetical protein